MESAILEHGASPRRRARRLVAALGCGLGTAGLLTSAAWAGGEAAVLTRPGSGVAAAIGIGPAYHSMAPPLLRFGPERLCSQRGRMAVGVRRRRGETVTLLSLTLGHHRVRLGRHRRAPLRIVLHDLPRGSFRLRLRLLVVASRHRRAVQVVRRYRACVRAAPDGASRRRRPGMPARAEGVHAADRRAARAG